MFYQINSKAYKSRLCSLIYGVCMMWIGFACAEIDVPPASTLDAALSVVGEDEVMPIMLTESKNLYFQARSGYYVFNFATQQPKLLCETGKAQRGNTGDRILCIPDSISSSLSVVGPLTGPILYLDSWNFSKFASPQLSMDGKLVATLIPQADDLDHVAVFNEIGDEIAKIKALALTGFLGPNHLVIHDPPQIWNFKDAFAEPMAITDRKMILHQEEPYGAVIEDDKTIYFLGVDDTASNRLIEGRLVAVKQQRILTYDRTNTGDIEITLYDLIEDKVVASYTHPGITFSKELYLELVDRNSVIVAEQNSRNCGSERVQYHLKSTLINMKTQKSFILMDEDTPHQVVAHHKAPYAVVSELDNCARPTGYSFLRTVKTQKKVDLPSDIRDKVEEATLSTLGDFIILRGAESVWLMDTESLSHRLIHGNEPIMPGLDLD